MQRRRRGGVRLHIERLHPEQQCRQRGGGGVCAGFANNCLISSNSSLSYGGGAYSNTLISCILRKNSAGRGIGGGAYSSALLGCTVVSNSALSGGGMWGGAATNSIIYFNANGGNTVDTKALVSCCTIPLGSVTNDPLFVNLAAGDYH